MMPRLGGVTLSVLVHAGLIVGLLAWSTADWTRPLFVDLVEHPEPADGPAAVGPAARSSERAAPAGLARVPARAAEPRSPAVLTAATPSALPPAPVTPVDQPVAPPAVAPPVVAEPAPLPVAPTIPPAPASAASPAAPPVADGRSGLPDAGSVGRETGPVRGDAEMGARGPAGSSLALATAGTGGPGAVSAEYGPYLRRFRQRVLESLIYPLAARRQGLAGTVELHVWLEPTGRVRDVQIARSSSHGILDDAAIETIRRLGPVPFPESVPRRPLLIRIPLVYELR